MGLLLPGVLQAVRFQVDPEPRRGGKRRPTQKRRGITRIYCRNVAVSEWYNIILYNFDFRLIKREH